MNGQQIVYLVKSTHIGWWYEAAFLSLDDAKAGAEKHTPVSGWSEAHFHDGYGVEVVDAADDGTWRIYCLPIGQWIKESE